MGSTGIKASPLTPTPGPSRREGSANSVQTNLVQARPPLLRRFLSPGGGTEGGLKTIERGRFPGSGEVSGF